MCKRSRKSKSNEAKLTNDKCKERSEHEFKKKESETNNEVTPSKLKSQKSK